MNTEAFDKVLETIVTAEDAALNRGFEPYRFECLYCGEEVRLAAPFSNRKSTHFRHLHGNNDKECESYSGPGFSQLLGRNGARHRSELADIYYSESRKGFILKVKLSSEEIDLHESNNESLGIKTHKAGDTIKSVSINRANFIPDAYIPFALEQYAEKYYVSIGNGPLREYDFIPSDTVVLFRVFGDEDSFLAKRIRSSDKETVIYTNTKYLAISTEKSRLEEFREKLSLLNKDIDVFKTMKGKLFYSLEVYIETSDNQIEESLEAYRYRLEKNESVVIIWPPCFESKGVRICDEEDVYVYSSFGFKPHSGNNIDEDMLEHIDDCIDRIAITKDIKIYRKNNEIVISHMETEHKEYITEFDTSYANVYRTPEDGDTLLFDGDEVVLLNPGQQLFLSEGMIIRRYKNNMLIEVVYPIKKAERTKAERIEEARKYYRFQSAINVQAYENIDELKKCITDDGKCNAAIIQLYKRGMI